ncbi:hypothetical protein [Actinocorallia sp. A-T 12471]|uniref:hypothetical protein n=1 Tax=Actinocorallia sp. A-T 12471 TaxID=3089813 RepID=UPI0029CC0E3C|nr:hypothetical protein [Actinocorallia sp. A-T 12471]MDX6740139.1 hypothetical protein [Actinocorallia sp. A-T 12471]
MGTTTIAYSPHEDRLIEVFTDDAGLEWVLEGEGPWAVKWAWDTGYRGISCFPTHERAATFCIAMFDGERKADSAKLASVSARNTETGELLPGLSPHEEITSPRQLEVAADACGTCAGSGTITPIQTGVPKPCTRCDGSGVEPGVPGEA